MTDPTRPCSYCNGSGVEPDTRAIGASFRERRKRLGLSVQAIADKLEISRSYVSDLERGNRKWLPYLREKYEGVLKK